MQVDAIELGERPVIFSRARRYAPAGAKAFADLLAKHDFADNAFIVLDWKNQLGQVPTEVGKPMLHIRVRKILREYSTNNILTVDSRLDVDDVFGNDEVTAEVIVDLVQELRNTVAEQVAVRRQSSV